jgi:hypothetical protein
MVVAIDSKGVIRTTGSCSAEESFLKCRVFCSCSAEGLFLFCRGYSHTLPFLKCRNALVWGRVCAFLMCQKPSVPDVPTTTGSSGQKPVRIECLRPARAFLMCQKPWRTRRTKPSQQMVCLRPGRENPRDSAHHERFGTRLSRKAGKQ